MLLITISEILKITNGKLIVEGKKKEFEGLDTDTRRLNEGYIYVAIKGERVNGNELVNTASENGAALCIVEEEKFHKEELNENTSVILVKDTRQALITLAKYYREKFDIKIVGVTGSTGKTSSKDVIASALSSKYNVFKTIGNYNSDIGLPIMIFKLKPEHQVAILEMGMSNLGEIDLLAEIARPDIAVITNVGISHIENLKTKENILKAKMEITNYFNKDCILIINDDNDMLHTVDEQRFKVARVGTKENVDYKALNIKSDGICIKFRTKEKISNMEKYFHVELPGIHNVINSLLAIAVCRSIGMNFEEIECGLEKIETTGMRLEVNKGKKFTIINDAYNASPDSMKAAIDVMCDLSGNKRIAILGSMNELGDESYKAHFNIGKYAREKGIDMIICMGNYSEAYIEGYGDHKKAIKLNDYDEICNKVKEVIGKDDIVLVKASRTLYFENIVKKLEIINY